MNKRTIKRAKALRRELKRLQNEKIKHDAEYSLCTFGGVFPRDEYEYEVDVVCHAAIKRYQKAKAIVTLVDNHKIKRDRLKKGYTIPFYRWLLNESPYADVFITKNPRTAINLGIICRTDVPSNLLLGALTATRYGWERDRGGSRWMQVWGGLRKRGVRESLAFVLCHHACLYNEELSWGAGRDHHSCISLEDMTVEGLKAFVKSDLTNAVLFDPIKYRRSALGVFDTWKIRDSLPLEEVLKEAAKSFGESLRGRKGLLGINKNHKFKFEQGLDVMANWAKCYSSEQGL